MDITLLNIYPQIGKATVGKILLVEFNTPTHPFNYINGTKKNNQIECRCITSSSSSFIMTSDFLTKCMLRSPQATFTNFAITLDVDVPAGWSLKCFFPGWDVTATSYQAYAKLINEESSFPPYINNVNEYGGIYKTTSNTLTFVSSFGTSAVTVD